MPDVAIAAPGYSPQWTVPYFSEANLAFNGANKYTVYMNTAVLPFTLNISKSVDGGATWAPVGGVGPGVFHFEAPPGLSWFEDIFSVVQKGSLLYVFYPESVNGFIAVTIFDMAADAWGITYTSAIICYGWYIDPTSMLFTNGKNDALYAALRANGDFVILYHGEEEVNVTSIAPQIHYTEFFDTTKTWGVETLVSEPSPIPQNARGYNYPFIVLSGTRIHFFYNLISGPNSRQIFHRSLSPANILGTQQGIGNNCLEPGFPIAFTWNLIDYVAVPWNQVFIGFSTTIWVSWAASADDPVWNIEDAELAALPPHDLNPKPCGLDFKDGCLYCFFNKDLF